MAQKKFRQILVADRIKDSKYVNILEREVEDLEYDVAGSPRLIEYQGKFYIFDYLLSGEFAGQWREASVYKIED